MSRLFTITKDHIKLLKRAEIQYNSNSEFGAPEIDPKRPYGNSYVYGDIAEILGIKKDEDGEFPEEDIAYMGRVHVETTTVLKIAVMTGIMEIGTYDLNKWEKVDD